MLHLIRKLWRDDSGAMLATEWVFMGTILILGIIPGMVAFRNSLNTAMLKSACALNSSSCACSGTVNILADSNVILDQSPCD